MDSYNVVHVGNNYYTLAWYAVLTAAQANELLPALDKYMDNFTKGQDLPHNLMKAIYAMRKRIRDRSTYNIQPGFKLLDEKPFRDMFGLLLEDKFSKTVFKKQESVEPVECDALLANLLKLLDDFGVKEEDVSRIKLPLALFALELDSLH